jgi:hypothetical protein
VLSVALSANAGAAIRSGSASDPRDTPGTPDIKNVALTYNTAGSLRLEIKFYDSLAEITPPAPDFAYWGAFEVLYRNPDPASECGFPPPPQFVRAGAMRGAFSEGIGQLRNGLHTIPSFGAAGPGVNQASIYTEFVLNPDGTGGPAYAEIPLENTAKDSGRRVIVTATDSLLANRQYECFTYTLESGHGSGFGFEPGPTDSLDGPVWLDDARAGGARVRSHLRGFDADGGCHAVRIEDWRLGPKRVAGEKRAFGGKVVVKLRGGGESEKVRLPADLPARGRRIGGLEGGVEYALKAHYFGDAWRKASAVERSEARSRDC